MRGKAGMGMLLKQNQKHPHLNLPLQGKTSRQKNCKSVSTVNQDSASEKDENHSIHNPR
jgi:hypothetical protein